MKSLDQTVAITVTLYVHKVNCDSPFCYEHPHNWPTEANTILDFLPTKQ